MVTIAVAALFVGEKLIYSPLVSLWQSRTKEIHKLTFQVRKGQTLIGQEQAIRGRWDDMQKNTLPTDPSLAQVHMLRVLQDWAQESGVSLNATSPQWKNDSDNYKTLVYRVGASGSLWMLSLFIYDIEKGPLGLKLESLDMSSSDNTGQA